MSPTTTAFDEDVNLARFANRCQNCGHAKKAHAIRQPHRCPTSLKESYWLEWTPKAIAEVMKNDF